MAPVPPPPPPPSATIPNFSASSDGASIKASVPNKSALLKSIAKGARLKKAVTNDRSAPLVGGSSSGSGGNGATLKTQGNAENNIKAPTGLGGLFANGIPKLRPSTQLRAKIEEEGARVICSSISEKSKSVGEHFKLGKKEEDTGFKKPLDGNSKPTLEKSQQASSFGKNNGTLPPTLPRKKSSTVALEKSVSGLKIDCSKSSKWVFSDADLKLPAPRKFTKCTKTYLSSRNVRKGDIPISTEDVNEFSQSLMAKLTKAKNEEDFEECVRIKSKLKSLENMKEQIRRGETVTIADLPT